MDNTFIKLFVVCSMVALLGAGCMSQEAAPVPADSKPVDTVKTDTNPADSKPVDSTGTPTDTTNKPTGDTSMSPDRDVDEKELPVIDGSWKTYNNSAYKFSFQYPTRGRYAPEWNVSILNPGDERLTDGCVKSEAEPRSIPGPFVVGDTSFCVVREVDAGAGQRVFTDSFTAPRGEKIIRITFSKRLANGDLFEDETCHGKTVISSGTSCILFDEALYRAHLNQIVATYRHE